MAASLYREVRDAVGLLLASDVGDPLAHFGLTDLLESSDVAERNAAFAVAEAQGRAGATTDVISRIALGRLGLGESTAYGLALDAGSAKGTAVCGLLGPVGSTDVLVTQINGTVWRRQWQPAAAQPSPLDPDYLTVYELAPGQGRDSIPIEADLQARARLACAAEVLGVCEAMLETAVEYAKTRHQFGAPLASFQAVAHSLAWAATEIHQLRALLQVSLHGDALLAPDATLAAATKSLAGQVGRRVAQITLQVSGGIGFTWEYSHNALHRRVLTLDAVAGSAEALNAELGSELRERSGEDPDYPALISLATLADSVAAASVADRA
jgi:hypothetical protein